MADTKKKAATKAPSMRTVTLNGADYNIEKRLPESFLETKLSARQKYVPVDLFRDIMRGIGEFDQPEFGQPETIISSKDGTRLVKIEVIIPWNKPGKKEKVMLRGTGHHVFTPKIMLSDSAHGNFKILEARALRDAFKWSYPIFEFPEDEKDDGQPSPEDAKSKILNEVASRVKNKDDKEKSSKPSVDPKEVEKKFNEMFDDLKASKMPDYPSKEDIQNLGKSLRTMLSIEKDKTDPAYTKLYELVTTEYNRAV